MKNKFPIFAAIMLLLIGCRIWLDNSSRKLLAVAGINLISLLIVIVLIHTNIVDKLLQKIAQANVLENVTQRESSSVRRCAYLLYAPLIVFAPIYLTFWASDLGNDIISIIAVFFSLLEEDIVGSIEKFYVKRCLYGKSHCAD